MDATRSSPPDLLAALTEPQRQAVTHVDGPLLILAGPGSGKTRVVTHRIAHLLHQGIPPHQILALTFTNKAADEMRARVQRLVPGRLVWMGTFHRFCARLLRMYGPRVGLQENYTIYDMDDSLKALVQALEDARIDLERTTPEAIAHGISWAKNNLVLPEQYVPKPGHPVGWFVERAYPAYQKRLLASNAVDFDDLLLHVATLLRENPPLRADLDARHRYILVDEYQDTNLAQYAIVRALSVDHPNLAVTGDPDQSIYGWRGANLNNILDFERDFPSVRVVRLEQNYRSTKAILRVADELIQRNKWRKDKRLFTDNPDGQPVRLNAYPTQLDEAQDIAAQIASAVQSGRRRPRDCAIFYRTNALSRQIEHSLREQGLPYQVVNGLAFYQRKEIKDVLAYLHLLNNPANDVACLRIINTPARGIGKSTIARVQAHAQRRGLSVFDSARQAGLIEDLPKKAAVAVARFVSLFDRLGEARHAAVEEILGRVLSDSGYHEVLKDSESEEDQERLANLEELLTAAREFDEQHPDDGGLERFLEDSSLVADTDAFEAETDKVTLMTLHGAKGLEFPAVYIIAVENGLIPHERNKDDERRIEEERRLLFVGLTRAMEELQLSYAEYRHFRGRQWPTVPSPFLMELPRGEMLLAGVNGRRTQPQRDEWRRWEADDAEHSQVPEREWADEPAPDEDYSQLEPQSVRGRKEAEKVATLMTAADLLAREEAERRRPSPEIFRQGMLVKHPQYGPGTIIALSGKGARRTASVRFFGGGKEEKFVLAYSPLEPVGDDG